MIPYRFIFLSARRLPYPPACRLFRDKHAEPGSTPSPLAENRSGQAPPGFEAVLVVDPVYYPRLPGPAADSQPIRAERDCPRRVRPVEQVTG